MPNPVSLHQGGSKRSCHQLTLGIQKSFKAKFSVEVPSLHDLAHRFGLCSREKFPLFSMLGKDVVRQSKTNMRQRSAGQKTYLWQNQHEESFTITL